MVAAAHRVLSAIEAGVSEDRRKQAQGKRGRNLPEGHEGLF
jgi:hypothetical protein